MGLLSLLPALAAASSLPFNLSEYVDPTTPAFALQTSTPDQPHRELTIVFSDEFNVTWEGNRSWTPTTTVPGAAAQKKWSATYQLNTDSYGATFLHPQMVTASNGTLHLRGREERYGGAAYLGAQLTTWNRVCFQGGYLEVCAPISPSSYAPHAPLLRTRHRHRPILNLVQSPSNPQRCPARPQVAFMLPPTAQAHPRGVWTAIWIMGNLARDVYPASVESVWPFSYDECQCPGPEAEYGLSQKISKCDLHAGRYGLNGYQGRGAPELDLLETIICSRQMTPHLAQNLSARANDTCLISSLQLAPRLPGYLRPVIFGLPGPLQTPPSAERPWYADSVSYGPYSTINGAFYGMNNYDTMGAMTVLDPVAAYTSFHTVGLHVDIGPTCKMNRRGGEGPYTPHEAEACLNQSSLTYYHDGVMVTHIKGSAFRARGGLLAREFPQEPMYILLGLKLSPDRWGQADPSIFPLDFQIEYVRLYQDLSDGQQARLSCNPDDHPTAEWIEGHHLDYGVGGASYVSTSDLLAAVLIVVGSLVTFSGSLELRTLMLLAEAGVASVCVCCKLFQWAGLEHAGTILFAPTYLPFVLSFAFLATLIPTITALAHSVGAALGAGILALQLTHHIRTAPSAAGASAPPIAADMAPISAIIPPMAIALILPLASTFLRLPRAHHEAITAALAGSQAAAVGAAHFLGCAWLAELEHAVGVSAAGEGRGQAEDEPTLLYASVALALAGAAYQYVRHALRGSLRHRLPSVFGGQTELWWQSAGALGRRSGRTARAGRMAWERMGAPSGKASATLNEPLTASYDTTAVAPRREGSSGGSGSGGGLPSEAEQMAWEAALGRELDIEPPVRDGAGLVRADGGSGMWAPTRSSIEMLEGCSTISALREAAVPMTRAFGLQESSVEVQCAHLSALINDARRNGLDESMAARKVHAELTSNYGKWCHALGVPRRSGGVVDDCLLLLCVWGEGANLRHMPELLCWLFHQLCANRHALSASPRAAPANAPASPASHLPASPSPTAPRSPPATPPAAPDAAGPVVCYSFLASVVRPIVDVARWRMRADLPVEQQLTYDDLNEFFWEAGCVRWLPFAHDGPRCVTAALRLCPKTHMEARKGGWLHLFHCFHRPLYFSVLLTYISVCLAYCSSQPTPVGQYVARLSLGMWLFSLYCLSKELLDAWAEASLTPSTASAPPSMRQQGVTVWRVAGKAAYATFMGALGLSAALTTNSDDTSGSVDPPSALQWPRDTSSYAHAAALLTPINGPSLTYLPQWETGLGPAAPRWVGFWVLGFLQVAGYLMYSRLQGRLPLVRHFFSTPYRASRIGERFYGTKQHSSPRGVAFWVLLAVAYLVMHFNLIAIPSAKGFSNFLVLRSSGAASTSEFAALVLALWLPAVPTGIIVSDVLFQVFVVALSLGLAKCCDTRKGAPGASGFGRLATSYQLARGGFATHLLVQPSPKAAALAVSMADEGAHGAGGDTSEDAFGCSWDAIIDQLRSRDLLSDAEGEFMRHLHITTATATGKRLLPPPLFLAPSLHTYLKTGKMPPQADVRVDDAGVDGACVLLEAIAIGTLGAAHRADVDTVASGLRELLPCLTWERLRAGPLDEITSTTRTLCTALGAPSTAGGAAERVQQMRTSSRALLDLVQHVKQIALLEIKSNAHAIETATEIEAALRRLYAACDSLSTWAADTEDERSDAPRAHARQLARALAWMLEPASASARPRCEEARRRLRSFVRSLQMAMPDAVRVDAMAHVSLLTPVYKETVVFSLEELHEAGSDGRPLLTVLQDLYADEWAHLCERIALPLDARVEQLLPHGAHEAHCTDVRLWASMRGQTLCRTVCGMMSYRAALTLQARLEGADAELIKSRFEFVVSCQMYGEQKMAGEAKADDVDLLLRMHEGLRVAYIARTPADPTSGAEATFDAVLLVSTGGRAVETARVRLPGDPIVGEGKPENQNVGMPFTRGAKLMILDMNQDGYFEEALKLRNLLQEFNGGGGGGGSGGGTPDQPPVTIVGFPEHIFTQSSGFVTAIYMAMQERYFGTFYQRVLSEPLGVRFHYGHPDLLDKVHFLTRGGVSSASKQINLSEDVFAGYKTVLRGGRIVFKEYHQVGKGRMTNLSEISAFFAKLSQGAACQLMSRDLYRLTKALPLERQLSLLHGGFGFYIVNCLTMYLVQVTAFLLAVLNVAGLLPYFQTGSAVALSSINLWMPLIVSGVLMLPDAVMVMHERGTRLGFHYLYGKIITLAPLYYIFISQTRAYHFANTMRWGSADYYVTRRAVSINHTPLHELFMTYGRSHYYPAIELLLVLLVALAFGAPSDMYNATWMLWLIGLALLYVPTLYNPNALHLSTLCSDVRLLREWLSFGGIGGDQRLTWRAWWEASTPPASAHGTATLIGQTLMVTIYAYLAGGMLLYSNTSKPDGYISDAFSANSLWQLSLGGSTVVPAMALAAFDSLAGPCLRGVRPWLMAALLLAAVAWFIGVTQSIQLVSRERIEAGSWAGGFAPTFYAVPTMLLHTMTCSFGLAGVGAMLTIAQAHIKPARDALRWVHRTRDYLLLAGMSVPLFVLALLYVPHVLQTRLVFQGSAFFFSDTARGRTWCACSAACFGGLMAAWGAYNLLWFMGYVGAPPVGWFSC